MKKIITFIAVILFSQLFHFKGYAQTPNAIPYQGVARNASGAILGSQPISLRFSLHDVTAVGTVVYQETHSATTTTLGLFTLNIGTGTSSIGTMASVDWANGAKFLQVEMDATGGTAYVDMGTTQMLSVPFALYAKIAGSTPGAVVYKGTWDAVSNTPHLTSSVGVQGDMYIVSNASPILALNTNLDGNNKYLIGDTVIFSETIYQRLSTSTSPIKAGDVNIDTNGDIVSTNVQDAIVEVRNDTDTKLATKLNLSGGTMTGDLVLNAPPTLALGAATKQYVDDSSIPVQAQFASLIDSYIHKTEDGVSIYLEPGTTDKRFGIGITTPSAPLGIRAEGSDQKVLSIKPNVLSTGSPYTFSLSASGNPGLNIESNAATGSVSRFFIHDTADGYVGIGTVTPEQKLHIQGANDGGSVGVIIQNSATTKNRAWVESHFETGDIPTQDGRFAISELPIGTSGSSSPVERLTILSGGNVGINELIPDTKFHVSRPLSDPASAISLLPGTGIVTIGPMENNIVADYRGIQARQGSFSGSGSFFEAASLNIQRVGGDVLIHGDASLASSQKAIITTDAKLGLGTISPTEKIDIDGAIKIGTTTTNNEGTIRYTGTDFEGRKAGAWVSLTGGSIWGKVDNSDSIYYTSSSQPKVGIGIATPTSSLHVFNNENALSSSNTVFIDTQSTTSSTSSSLTRVGLEIKNSLTWSSSSDAKNIGLYVSNVSGQSSQESNIAAVLNGNVVVGDLNASKAVGTGGTNVLAIQNGAVPQTTPSSATDIGIQMYSANLPSSPGAAPVSALHVMNGNGDIMKLYKQDALTPTDTATPNSGDAATDALINNLRLRLNELETRLQNLGLLSN